MSGSQRSSNPAYLSEGLSFPTTIRSLTGLDSLPCTELSGELWVPIRGTDYEYFVSNMGRVLSRKFLGHPKWGLLSPARSGKSAKSGHGYLQVVLYVNGKKLRPKVHRLVAEHFILNPSGLPQVNHINGDTLDNRAKNLEWCTNTYNQRHYQAHRGKLSREKVDRIRAEFETWTGTKQRFCEEQARINGVCVSSVKNVLNGVTWRS